MSMQTVCSPENSADTAGNFSKLKIFVANGVTQVQEMGNNGEPFL